MRFALEDISYQELMSRAHAKTAPLKLTKKVWLFADWSVQFLSRALVAYAKCGELNLEVKTFVDDDLFLAVLKASSQLENTDYKPDFVIILSEYHRIKEGVRSFAGDADTCVENYIQRQRQIISAASSISENIVIGNYPLIDGHLIGRLSACDNVIAALNEDLFHYSEKNRHIIRFDISSMVSIYGRDKALSEAQYYNSKCRFSFDFMAYIARILWNYIAHSYGTQIKCIVVDLDDTLYGGTISEDGIQNIVVGGIGLGESYRDLQLWLKDMKDKGLFLAICSKNDPEDVNRLFVENNQMILDRTDFSYIYANWINKAENIDEIARGLNIHLDSVMFLDDQKFEREAVKSILPDVYVPDLSEYPELRLTQLHKMSIFFEEELTEEDLNRTQMLSKEKERIEHRKQFEDFNDYLKYLEMRAIIEPLNKGNLQRISELSMRSNRCNLRTVRYSVKELEEIMSSPEKNKIWGVTLEDNVGTYGLVGVISISRKSSDRWFLNNFFMSCRALERGLENFMMNHMAKLLVEQGVLYLEGEYIPTAKNQMMADFLEKHQFKKNEGNIWVLDLNSRTEEETTIREKK